MPVVKNEHTCLFQAKSAIAQLLKLQNNYSVQLGCYLKLSSVFQPPTNAPVNYSTNLIVAILFNNGTQTVKQNANCSYQLTNR
jgi:hypothetical protein